MHIIPTIPYLLTLPPKLLRKATPKHLTYQEYRRLLKETYARGEIYINCGCPGFDPKTGCPGFTKEDRRPA